MSDNQTDWEKNKPEVQQHEIHDVPTLEQRVANLESVVSQHDTDITTVFSTTKRLWNKVFPKQARNCKHCGRQCLTPVGTACGVCGKK